ncbi:hypothetical protein X777_16309 [Ooceraea biroi]|uniref:Endonuclease/exonuclease/phosphatase domain-containing protein n=1 Tax=Ooceraea biroi TaxID=2015173 RepID=A0A026WUL3_OOCBI|nr:hypothetical protein X777_16309 [Ooceraea biroi]
MNKEGKELVEFISERGWMIVNGGIEGDEKGEWTYTGGRGESVIDYILVNEEGWDRIRNFEVGENVDSDHQSITVRIEGREERRRKRGGGEKGIGKGIWTERARERYKGNLGEVRMGEGKIEEEIEKINRRIKGAMVREEEEGGEKRGKGWWDRECREVKKKVRREMRKWRRDKANIERYKKEKLEYRKLCERKRKEENEN